MSFRQAARRLAPLSTPSLTTSSSSRPVLVRSVGLTCAHAQRRHKWSLDRLRNWAAGRTGTKAGSESVADNVGLELEDPERREEYRKGQRARTSEGGIFEDEIDHDFTPDERSSNIVRPVRPVGRTVMAMTTDPNPRARIRWHRKKVIQMVRCNGKLTREQTLKMTERELLHKSGWMPTSTKKLVMLSRQIAGKTLDDAIVQMKWSKKKMSKEILYYLEEARDLAVAQRGMGLGKVKGELLDKPRKIRNKDGKWVQVIDPTRIYIAQSWVGRGKPHSKSMDYKARGRGCMMRHPRSSFSVLLKEEKTRMRQHEEEKAKKAAKGPWVHLPDRPLHGQRPYYTW
ncbi:hypothetical protein XA68_10726 [Ophiocordyceps unilateralis]|uniref:54S ribosomal protein L22, mitochondrial n=1 Tax=Ophiocordyceps unilateralis TaxID=268505 RepID=A0A2A9PNA4_OPHUN|nr:hypothetical protein XA68_10726 [Ophiocordyceps unilateralis]